MKLSPKSLAPLLVLATIACGVVRLFAYTFEGNDDADNGGLPRWPDATITFRYNEKVSADLANVDSDPRTAIEAALATWSEATGLEFVSGTDITTTEAANDEENIITFEDTAQNRALVGDLVAVTLIWRDDENALIEADIVYNPDRPFSTTGASDSFPLEAITAHEIGHMIGLEHSAVAAATMWPYVARNNTITEGATLPASLTHDDKAGAAVLYPIESDPPAELGSVAGLITLDGDPVYGAHVVAISQDQGIVYGAAMTPGENQGDEFGRYQIERLPGGCYQIFAEPADGPAVPENWTGDFSNGEFWGGDFTPGWQTTFTGGNTSPTTVVVVPGRELEIDIAVEAGEPNLNPTFVSFSADGETFPSSRPLALNFEIGESRDIVIVGEGVHDVPNSGLRGPAPMFIDENYRVDGFTTQSRPYSIFRVTLNDWASAGAASVILRTDSEVAVFTGIIYMNGIDETLPNIDLLPPTVNELLGIDNPLACDDINGDGAVDVADVVFSKPAK